MQATSKIEAQLRERAAFVDSALAALFCEPELNSGLRLHESMRYSLESGGKRLRPVLLLEFAALGGLERERAADFACAIELIHTYSLIHDDLPCMDNDTLRRGRPCSHVTFGEAGALLAGDALLNAAFELMLLSDNGVSPEARLNAAGEIAKASGRCGMIGGQALDLQNENGGQAPDADGLRRLCLLKTGAIISGACVAGLLLAGEKSAEKLAAARSFGEALGLAFQMRDDLLDVTGSAEKLGKSVGTDSRDGKRTWPDILGIPGCGEEIMAQTAQAKAALGVFEERGFLTELADYLTERDR